MTMLAFWGLWVKYRNLHCFISLINTGSQVQVASNLHLFVLQDNKIFGLTSNPEDIDKMKEKRLISNLARIYKCDHMDLYLLFLIKLKSRL